MRFTWNLSPLQPSKSSFECLLLPPRSALEESSIATFVVYFHAYKKHPYSRTSKLKTYKLITKCRSFGWAPSIFRASSFGRWVVTRSLEVNNFHVHFPAVTMNQQRSDESCEQILRHLMLTTGWPRFTSSAYQDWTTRSINNTCYSSKKARKSLSTTLLTVGTLCKFVWIRQHGSALYGEIF